MADQSTEARLRELDVRIEDALSHSSTSYQELYDLLQEAYGAFSDEITRLRAEVEMLAEYRLFAGETAGKCLGLAMSTDHPAPDDVLMGIFSESQRLAALARTTLNGEQADGL